MNGYLCISRKKFESLSITTAAGERIELKVADIQRGKVRLALSADKSIKILRSELEAKLQTA